MKALQWVLRCFVFLLVLSFSLRNTQSVHIELLPGYTVQQPLIVILLISLLAGVIMAWVLMLPSWLKARKIISSSLQTTIKPTPGAEKENGI